MWITYRSTHYYILQFHYVDPYYDECNGDDHNRIRSYSQPDGSTDIEICLNSSWSKICADGWTRTHAKVACRELGLPYEGIHNQ